MEFYRAVQTTFAETPSHSPATASGDQLADAALRNRGSLTVWFSIETTLALRAVFKSACVRAKGRSARSCDCWRSAFPFQTIRRSAAGLVGCPRGVHGPTRRDSHIRSINEHGGMNWQKTSGYNRRSKVKAVIGCYPRDWGPIAHVACVRSSGGSRRRPFWRARNPAAMFFWALLASGQIPCAKSMVGRALEKDLRSNH